MPAKHLIVGMLRERRRQDRLLHLARHFKLTLQRHQLISRFQRLAPQREVAKRPVNRDPQILEVYWFGDKVEGTPVHRRADILHIPVSRDDHRTYIGVNQRDLREQRETRPSAAC